MRIAVAGATGNIGARTASFLEREGHEVIRISRSLGVDLTTGEGLDAALEGVDAVVDAISSPPVSPDETREYFGTTTRNLLAAEQRAGVRHHVLLSIVGIHRIEGGTAHYSGKREQERLIEEGRVPWTIVPATQFHDFAALAAAGPNRTASRSSPRYSCNRSHPTTSLRSWPKSPSGRRRAAMSMSPVPRPKTWSTWPGAPMTFWAAR